MSAAEPSRTQDDDAYIAFLACGSSGGQEIVDGLINLNRAAGPACDVPPVLVTSDASGLRVALPPGGHGVFLPARGDEATDVQVFGAPGEDLERVYAKAVRLSAIFCDADAEETA